MTAPRWAGAALVAAVAFIVHCRSIAFGFTGLDDRDFIVDDHAFLARPANVLRSFTRPYMSVVDASHPYYRPIVTASYGLDAQWSGMHPYGYHATNVVMHMVAALLFFALLRRMDIGRTVAPIVACIFAVHPLLGSAVAWIPGRNDLLLAVFGLSSWLWFLSATVRPTWSARLLHVVFFWLALLTKESAVVIPAVCIAHVLIVEPDGVAALRRGDSLVFPVGWLVGIAGRVVAHPPGATTPAELLHNLPLFVTGLGQIALPVNPSLITVREDLSVFPGIVVGCLIACACIVIPGVRWRVVVLGAAAFVLFLAPALAVPGVLVLSSRLYLPACGALIALAEIARALVRDRASFFAFGGVSVVVLGAMAAAYDETFRDRRAFARGAVDASPHSPLAHFCLGETYQIDGDFPRAIAEYRSALALGAIDVVHNNIAVIHMANGSWQQAEEELREEIAADPGYPRAYRNLGIVLRREGRIEEARTIDQKADALTTNSGSR